ncbi:MAG: tetratricopeptide repeat protein [Bacteroidales bacterium]|nr:tetratricopeptide repeat protein [Bacteroidales bacterium]MDY0161326.1 tetratricopeptide repeat protein [Bacteroidales bacterium]
MKIYCFIVIVFFVVSCNNKGTDTQTEEVSEKVSSTELREEISTCEDELFNHIETDTSTAIELIGKYVYYANTFKQDSITPEFLLRASEIAANIGQPHNAINYLNRIENDYPDFIRYGFSLYYTAHIYDYFLKNTEKAAEYYNKFINDYPQHQLANDAKMMLEIIYLSDEDLIKKFESLNE